MSDELEAFKEAARFALGWHPTDTSHPAFDSTTEYGLARLNWLLAKPEDRGAWEDYWPQVLDTLPPPPED